MVWHDFSYLSFCQIGCKTARRFLAGDEGRVNDEERNSNDE